MSCLSRHLLEVWLWSCTLVLLYCTVPGAHYSTVHNVSMFRQPCVLNVGQCITVCCSGNKACLSTGRHQDTIVRRVQLWRPAKRTRKMSKGVRCNSLCTWTEVCVCVCGLCVWLVWGVVCACACVCVCVCVDVRDTQWKTRSGYEGEVTL